MLNKELLMIQSQSYNPVYVTLRFFGGLNGGTDYSWISPDGTKKQSGVFDERVDVVETLTCKPNTTVSISTDNYSGDYTATPTTRYHSIRGVLQTSLNIHSIQRCSGSLLVSYRRASYA